MLSPAPWPSRPRRKGRLKGSLRWSGPVNLEVQTRSGDITVRSGPAGTVSVRGKIFVGDHWLFGGDRRVGEVHEIEQNPPLRQQGDSIHIDDVNVRNISVDYEITVPAETAVRSPHRLRERDDEGVHGNDRSAKADRATCDLHRLTGDIRIQTGSGNRAWPRDRRASAGRNGQWRPSSWRRLARRC